MSKELAPADDGARGVLQDGPSAFQGLRYLSVCAGIEAATAAWHPLGWEPAAFSEIEAFPRAVLAHHYPTVPLHGDFTTIEGADYGPIDLLVGGTPCQDFSVAGLRAGIAGDRGNLTLEFLRLAARKNPRWIVWENVPGVLSSDGGRALGAFLGGLAELGYGFAYRVLDAQYFNLAQRRARVFVVGYLGDWRRAAAVLFERESLLGHPAPSREKGEGLAPTISARTKGGGGLGTDFDCDGGLIAGTLNAGGKAAGSATSQDAECGLLIAYGQNNTSGPVDVSHALQAHPEPAGRLDFGSETFLVGPIAFSAKDHGADAGPVAPTLRSGSHDKSHANGGVMPAVAFAIQERAVSENPTNGPDGIGVRGDGTAYTLEARTVPQAVAFAQNQCGEVREGDVFNTLNTNSNASGRNTPLLQAASAVRRLTPRECERLQGFPDDYTLVPYRGKPASDGPRYKALGNSMAVPVMRWIGERIATVERVTA